MFIQAPVDSATLSRRLHVLLERSDVASLRARVEEQRVIHEELQRQAAAAASRAGMAMEKAAKAIEHSAKVKAFKAFLAAGGASAHFQRWWDQQFGNSWASRAAAHRESPR